jgi:hypothetical protein
MHNPPSRRIKMQQKRKSVDDWIEGECITWRGHRGFVNFICDEYITLTIKEYCIPDQSAWNCIRNPNQVNLLVYREYWHEVIPCDSK